MQALSLCSSKGGSFMVPQLDFELGSSSLASTRPGRRKEPDFLGNVCQVRSCGFLLGSRYSRCSSRGLYCSIPRFHLRSGFPSGYSKMKLVLLCKPLKGSSGSLAELACAVDELLSKEESSSFNEFSGNMNNHTLKIVNDDRLCDHEDENERLDINSGGVIGEEESARIDVRALACSLKFAKTVDDIEEVLNDKDEFPPQVYSTIIKGFGRDKCMDAAMALVEWLKRKKKETGGVIGPNLFIYNSLLGAVKHSQQFGEMEKILNDMAGERVVPNVVTYNSLMAIFVEQGKVDKALNVLEEIREKGFIPTPVSYSTALLAYRRMEDGNGALKFFVEFREKYTKGEIGKDDIWEEEFVKLQNFTVHICHQVMRQWLVKEGNLSTNVLKLLKDMDTTALKLSREDYERLVWACTREEHYVVAKELYSRIRERHSEISLSVCNHLIWLMGKGKKWWAALEIYEDLLDKGPKPNNMSYELIVSHFKILLTAARKRGIWRWGVRLLNKMEEKGLKPGSKEWNAVLVACSKASETTAAIQIFRRMVEQGERPTIISYGALLSALEKGKLYDEALRVWDHMIKVGVEPNVYAYTIMASVFTGKGNFKMVDAVFEEMAASGIEPTVVTYNAIISGCAQNSMSSAAYEWFHRMKVKNISPNEITYEMLIEALAKDGKPRLAYELYLRARNEALDLSSKAYDAVVRSSQAFGATIDFSVLGPRPADKKKKVQIRKTLTEFCNLADVPRRGKPFDRKEIYVPQTKENQ
ncbi:hypothetical protein SLA2020_077760 [Shorea laevis]